MDLGDFSFYFFLKIVTEKFDFDLLHHPLFVLLLSVIYTLVALKLLNYLPPFLVIPILIISIFLNYQERMGILLAVYTLIELLYLFRCTTREKIVQDVVTPSNYKTNASQKAAYDPMVMITFTIMLASGYYAFSSGLPPVTTFVVTVIIFIITLTLTNITTLGRNSTGDVILMAIVGVTTLITLVIFFFVMYNYGTLLIDKMISQIIDIPITPREPNYQRTMSESFGITADIWHIRTISGLLPLELTVGGVTFWTFMRSLVGEIAIHTVVYSHMLGPAAAARGRMEATPKLDNRSIGNGYGTMSFALCTITTLVYLYRLITFQVTSMAMIPIASGMAYILYKKLIECNWQDQGSNVTLAGRHDSIINTVENPVKRTLYITQALGITTVLLTYQHGIATLPLVSLAICMFVTNERLFTFALGLLTCNTSLVITSMVTQRPITQSATMNIITAGVETCSSTQSITDEIYEKVIELIKENFSIPFISKGASRHELDNVSHKTESSSNSGTSEEVVKQTINSSVTSKEIGTDSTKSQNVTAAITQPEEQEKSSLNKMVYNLRNRFVSDSEHVQNSGREQRSGKWIQRDFNNDMKIQKHSINSKKSKMKEKEGFREISSKSYQLDC